MWTYFSISASAWGQARSMLGGVDTSILHHAFISIFIALWAIITHYISILMAILSYFIMFTMKRGMPTAGILAGKGANIETYSTQLQKSWNSMKQDLGINKNFWAKEIGQGAHTLSRRQGGATPSLLSPLVGLRRPSSAISSLLPWKKSWASLRDETPPPRGGTMAEPI